MTDLEKQKINVYLDDKGLGHLKSTTLYKRGYQKIIDIIELPCWSDERFAHLLAPCTFNASPDNIMAIFELSYWDDPKNLQFLEPYHLALNCNTLVSRIEAYRSLLLGDYITAQSLKKTTEQINALYKYLIGHGIKPIINGMLHPLFSMVPGTMLRNYGVNLNWLVQMEREKKIN